VPSSQSGRRLSGRKSSSLQRLHNIELVPRDCQYPPDPFFCNSVFSLILFGSQLSLRFFLLISSFFPENFESSWSRLDNSLTMPPPPFLGGGLSGFGAGSPPRGEWGVEVARGGGGRGVVKNRKILPRKALKKDVRFCSNDEGKSKINLCLDPGWKERVPMLFPQKNSNESDPPLFCHEIG